MGIVKQLRKDLIAFKKRGPYTWEEISKLSKLGRPWLINFTYPNLKKKPAVGYRGSKLRKLSKFLDRT